MGRKNYSLQLPVRATHRLILWAVWFFSIWFISPGTGNANEIESILAKHAQALGGLEKVRALTTSHAQATVTAGGFTGKSEAYEAPPGRFRQDIDLGIFNLSVGCDGTNWWIKDQNGIVRDLGEKEKEEFVTESFFSAYKYLTEDTATFTLRFLPEKSDSQFYAIAVKPQGGLGRTLFINRRTYLVDKSQQIQDGALITTTYADFRSVDGLLQPFHLHQSSGQVIFDTDIRITSVETNVAIDPAVFARPGAAARRDFAFAPGKTSTTVPFELVNNHIYFSATLQGSVTGSFLLDTGAGAVVLDSTFAAKSGLVGAGGLEAKGVSGSEKAGLVKIGSLTVGDVTFDSLVAATLDLQPLTQFEGHGIDGILGYDILARVVVEVDYEKSQLTFSDPDLFTYTGTGQVLPMTLDQRIPHVEATVEGQYRGWFNVDTGSRNTLDLFSPFVFEHTLADKYPKRVETRLGGIGDDLPSTTQMVRMKSFTVGSFEIPDLLVGLSTAQKGIFASEKFQGNIGSGLLKRFTVIFNYPKQQLILFPNRHFGERDEFDKSGLWLREVAGKFIVEEVVKGTAGDKSGFKRGDAITEINGKPAREYSLNDLRALFRGPDGTKFSLKFQRTNKEKKKELKLKTIL